MSRSCIQRPNPANIRRRGLEAVRIPPTLPGPPQPRPVRKLNLRLGVGNFPSEIPPWLFIPFHRFALAQNYVLHGCCHMVSCPQVSDTSFWGPPMFSPRVTTGEVQLSCGIRLKCSSNDVWFTGSTYHRVIVGCPHVGRDQIPLLFRASRLDRFQDNPSGHLIQPVRDLGHPS